MASPPPSVIRCPAELRPAALRRLHRALPADQQTVLVQLLERITPADSSQWEGLLVRRNGEATRDDASVDGVLWVQEVAGNTAVLWTPPYNADVGEPLLRAAATYVDARRIPLAQLVVGEHDGYSADLHQRCGFPRFAELLYLVAELSPRPPSAIAAPANELRFLPHASDEPQRLSRLLEQTYVDTLDCPGLDGVRPMHDVLEGYRAQGRHLPAHWYFVLQNGADVGALILAEHPGFSNWELVYMGVIPQARGQKIGEKIIRFALDAAAQSGAERLVLAVDSANAPALAAYRRAGFYEWDRRIVYARLQSRA